MENNYTFVDNANQENSNEYIAILDGTLIPSNRIKVFETLRRRQYHENNDQFMIKNVSTNPFIRENSFNGLIEFFENFEPTHNIQQNTASLYRQEFQLTNQDDLLLLDTNADAMQLPFENRGLDSSIQDRLHSVNNLIARFETLRNEQYEHTNNKVIEVQKLIINEEFKKKLEKIVENTYKVLKCISYTRESSNSDNKCFDINIEQKIFGFRHYRRTLHA